MFPSRAILLVSLISLIFGPLYPAQSQSTGPALAPDSPLAPEAYPILTCPVTGITGDLADLRGIRFTVAQSFTAIEVRLSAATAGNFTILAELRNSTGFTGPTLATTSTSGRIPHFTTQPYLPVTFTFNPVAVSGTQTYTLKFSITSGTGSVYFETAGIGNMPCANVEETEENNVALPTVRGDPTGFKVLAANPSSWSISSAWTGTPPLLDGQVSSGEWDLGNKIPFENGFLTVRNDAFRLYVLFDVLYDRVNDTGQSPDYIRLAFDKDKNAAITPNVDIMYGNPIGTDNLRYQFFLGANSWTGAEPVTRSARGHGFGCFFADSTLSFTFVKKFSSACAQHVVWELGIDLNEIGAAPGGTVKMGFRVASPSPEFVNEVPPGFGGDFSNLITVSLAPSAVMFPAPAPGAVVSLDARPVEVTQAIQDRDNSLQLAANKTTVARVYVNVAGTASAQPSLVWLYGALGGADLPGSPQLRYFIAPTSVNRATTNNTANFTLPKSWTSGSVAFSARVRAFTGAEDAKAGSTLVFRSTMTPNYWIVPINIGSASSPILVNNAEIASQESYLRAVYPVPNVNFTQKDWSVVGPTTVNGTIDALNDYYSNIVMAWILGYLFMGSPPFTLPDQVYGFTPSGGGISDPTWYGGLGYVARGYLGSSHEGTMSHEINHNLDRSTNGTWGRHVGDPRTTVDSGGNVVPVYNGNYGCGAAGPDPNWPVPGDDSIYQVGFDTRSATFGAVPATHPDFMSYCQASNPTKWISPYRWSNELSTFIRPANEVMLDKIAAAAIQDVYYVSGHIDRSGTGGLKPVVTQKGIPTTLPLDGNAAIQVLNGKGGVLGTFFMQVVFPLDEEEPVETFMFNLQLPLLQGAQKFVLLYQGKPVDDIAASANPPTVTLTSPNGGENWTGGIQTVTWSANDLDKDPLTFSLLYTPDDGQHWYPVAAGLTGTSFSLDAASLPSGTAARMRVIVSDGFYTAQDDSDGTFTVAANPLTVVITSPEPNSFSPVEAGVNLEGNANSPDDPAIPDGQFIWSEGATNLGSGRSVHVQLPLGTHVISLFVADSAGNSQSVSATVYVGQRMLLPVIRR